MVTKPTFLRRAAAVAAVASSLLLLLLLVAAPPVFRRRSHHAVSPGATLIDDPARIRATAGSAARVARLLWRPTSAACAGAECRLAPPMGVAARALVQPPGNCHLSCAARDSCEVHYELNWRAEFLCVVAVAAVFLGALASIHWGLRIVMDEGASVQAASWSKRTVEAFGSTGEEQGLLIPNHATMAKMRSDSYLSLFGSSDDDDDPTHDWV